MSRSIFFRATPSQGVTLVELTIGLLIISAIGSIAVSSFMDVMRNNREVDDRSNALEQCQSVIESVRQVCANLAPTAIGNCQIFTEGIDSVNGRPYYEFLRSMSDYSAWTNKPGSLACMEHFELVPHDEVCFDLIRNRQLVGLLGPFGEAESGKVAFGLQNLSLSPVYQEEVAESENGEGERIEVLTAFRIEVRCGIPGEEGISLTSVLPVGSRPRKGSGEE
jgi:hypothetical protein